MLSRRIAPSRKIFARAIAELVTSLRSARLSVVGKGWGVSMASASNVLGRAESSGEDEVKRTALIGVGSVWFAIAQAACATTVFLKSVAIVLGISTVSAAATLDLFHNPAARIVLLLFAVGGAAANLYVVWNFWRLRRRPEARWRLRPLGAAERRRIAIALTTALLTFAVLGVEVWAHLLLHPLH